MPTLDIEFDKFGRYPISTFTVSPVDNAFNAVYKLGKSVGFLVIEIAAII